MGVAVFVGVGLSLLAGDSGAARAQGTARQKAVGAAPAKAHRATRAHPSPGRNFPQGVVLDVSRAPYFALPEDGKDDETAIQRAISRWIGLSGQVSQQGYLDGVFDV